MWRAEGCRRLIEIPFGGIRFCQAAGYAQALLLLGFAWVAAVVAWYDFEP